MLQTRPAPSISSTRSQRNRTHFQRGRVEVKRIDLNVLMLPGFVVLLSVSVDICCHVHHLDGAYSSGTYGASHLQATTPASRRGP